MKNKIRPERVAEEVLKILSSALLTKVNDPKVKNKVFITYVRMSPDLAHANVYYGIAGEDIDKNSVNYGLEHIRGFLRHELAQNLQLRTVPELHFYEDESLERGARLDALLRELQQQENRD